MTITLSDGVTSLALDEDLEWRDEHAWSPVVQSVAHSLTGALIVQVATRQAGRPITLAASEDRGWITGTALAQLLAWGAIAGQVLTLTLRGATYSVMLRHYDAPAVEATPVVSYSDPISSDWYVVTLKFLVI